MENSGKVMIEGENYEVVDECVEEEDASNTTQNKPTENSVDTIKEVKDTQSLTTEEPPKVIKQDDERDPVIDLTQNTSDNLDSSIDAQNKISNVENKSVEQANTESVDFTADINLDQLDEQKTITDEDVLHNLDEIENIVLNSSDFQTEEETNESVEKSTVSNLEEKDSTEKNDTDKNVIVDQEKPSNDNTNDKQEEETEKNDWYEKKLTEKEAIIKERLSKVAKVLGISYPCYEKWLEWEEKMNGSPLCKLKPARRCCLDKPYTNRWKFTCSRKRAQESTKKPDDANTSASKNAEAVWKLEASGVWGVNVKNESEFPPFVLHAVKIFEEFLQMTEQSTTQEATIESFTDDVPMGVESKKDIKNEVKQDWLWLVVRCNSMDELMLFATGKNISRSTMDHLKQVFESGPGKDCNVKSLYCKSINKYDDTTVTNTTFLVGSEALDEVVGGLKMQLAPKTNFWSNAAGAENVAKAVMDLLAPTPKTTVLEIGCGIGLIGLMMASKCQQVIGVDSPSEVEEAEMTCELNNIKNASFIMGSPSEVTNKIVAAVTNRKTCAVINASTNIGRAIEVMTCLKKIASLKRIVMITTLTKQSVRAILELARPVDNKQGLPFIPISACVVDTLPTGPNFEAVILMQRRMMNKFNQPRIPKNIEELKASETKNTQEKINEQSTNGTDKKLPVKTPQLQMKNNFNKPVPKPPMKNLKILVKNTQPLKTKNLPMRNKFKGKRPHSPDKVEAPPKKIMKKFGKPGAKPWNTDLTIKKKKEWSTENPHLRMNPLHEKKLREYKEQADLRERLSHNRLDTDIAQKVKEHQALLEIAKEKLSGPAPTVDINTAKQLQDMLNMVLEQTNKLQSQLPRSVWDRIAPPENVKLEERENKNDPLLKGRYVQEMGSQDILITTANKQFLNDEEQMTKPLYKKYNNLPPLEPNTIMPVAAPCDLKGERSFRVTPERYRETGIRQQQCPENTWNRDKMLEKNRWNEMENTRRPVSPMRRQISPMKHRVTPPERFSPKRPLLSPPRRPCSPPRRHFSPTRRPMSPMCRQRSPLRRRISPLRRPLSPPRRPMSPRHPTPPQRQNEVMLNLSPIRRQSPMRRQSPPRRQIPSPNRMVPPNRQMISLSRRQAMPQERQQMSPMKRGGSPHRPVFGRPESPPRRLQSPQKRPMSPQQRFADDWDIPSRGAIEQSTWSRPMERMPEQNVWRNQKTSTPNNNWESTSCNDKRRKTFNQDSSRENTWNDNGNTWDTNKQMSAKPMMKDTWSSGADNRWSNTANNMPGTSNDNWNIRGKESFMPRNEFWPDSKKPTRWESVNVKDSWKQTEKEDLNDLPEDARDPWGDNSNLDTKERWHKFENPSASSTWIRESEQKGDTWSKQKDNWQPKGLSFGTKSQWQNNGMQNVGESCWMPQSNIEKKTPSTSWQGGNSVGSWQSQNSNFQSRPFSTSQFKGLH